MDVTGISLPPSPYPARPVGEATDHHHTAASRAGAQSTSNGTAGQVGSAERVDVNAAPDPVAAAAPTVRVEVDLRPAGGQTVTVFDIRTGQAVYQLPPEQVVRILDEVLERTQGKESRNGQ